MLEVSGNCCIANTELDFLTVWSGSMADQGLTVTASLVVIMVAFAYASSVFTDSAFGTNHSGTRIRSFTLAAYADFMFTTLDTCTRIIGNTGSVMTGCILWALDTGTWVVWNALSINTSTTITYHAGTWVWSNALTTDALSAFWAGHTITWIGWSAVRSS
jgi:hypothetical protein